MAEEDNLSQGNLYRASRYDSFASGGINSEGNMAAPGAGAPVAQQTRVVGQTGGENSPQPASAAAPQQPQVSPGLVGGAPNSLYSYLSANPTQRREMQMTQPGNPIGQAVAQTIGAPIPQPAVGATDYGAVNRYLAAGPMEKAGMRNQSMFGQALAQAIGVPYQQPQGGVDYGAVDSYTRAGPMERAAMTSRSIFADLIPGGGGQPR